jgi:gamma-glutamylaminecyclotransferase
MALVPVSLPTHPLFVYGTLLRGELHHELLAGATFRGHARTAPQFALFDLGAYPAMVRNGTTVVHGELYETIAALLAELDRFEGAPELFRRELIVLADGAIAESYLFCGELPNEARSIPLGNYRTRRR